MSIENINSHTPENIPEEDENETGVEFPPFDPENAERLIEEVKAKKNNTYSIDVEAAYKILNGEQDNKKDSPEYDFGATDRYQEQTFMMAAANSLVDSPDIMRIDRVALNASERANKNNTTIFEALKTLSQESDDNDSEIAAIDLLNAFIDTTAAYVINKDEKPARGLARGLIITMEMQLASAPEDRANAAADKLRVDLELVRPIITEFIEEYNTDYESPNDFKDHLRTALEVEEIDLRSAKRRNVQPDPDTERRIQAIKSTLAKLDSLQSSYEDNFKNLKDTAYASHRIIK